MCRSIRINYWYVNYLITFYDSELNSKYVTSSDSKKKMYYFFIFLSFIIFSFL